MEEELPDNPSQPGIMVVRFQPDVVDQLRTPGEDEREVLFFVRAVRAFLLRALAPLLDDPAKFWRV